MPIFSTVTLQLPLLRSLSIASAWNLSEWGGDITHQQLRADINFILDTPQIISPAMDNEHFAFFCDVFKRSSGSRVRRLERPFTSMNAETFDHLSEAFPNLHALILSITQVSNSAISIPQWNVVS
ncbi:hypothetical protein BDN71DRAFT_1451185 [Pleurotus eryngii]|uniref:Uncharacterized protein n=1 Tax=Pleurotus eryngii TaxID=5323 RepID=A0A9P6DE19_PLEER|nr:hypothetical protein BDN71DRAFT_1451185 [Pleurotus eryngii]